jgi:serine protease inhibitor
MKIWNIAVGSRFCFAKRFTAILVVVCLLSSLTACSQLGSRFSVSAAELVAAPTYPIVSFEGTDKTLQKDIEGAHQISVEMKNAIDIFSYKTAEPILMNAPVNSCYSPLSLYYALALAGTGANGQTRAELLTLLGESDTGLLSKAMGDLYRLLFLDNSVSKLKIANSLWLDHEYQGKPVQYKDAFLKNATEQFYASLFKVDFAKQSAGETMAKWITEQTSGTLKPRFELDPLQLMSILNTIYFKNEWVDQFSSDQTKPDTFHLADGTDITCDFMNMTKASQTFNKGPGFTRAALNLKSNNQMVFVLPDQGVSIEDLVSGPDQLRELFEEGEHLNGKVIWKVPKFSYGSDFKLIETLESLGINSAFEYNADFTNITDHPAFISDIIQQTHIAIDEKGVEASAFTKIDYYGMAPPTSMAEMILDRPFLYAIFSAPVAKPMDTVQAHFGLPLFIGICGNPAET